MKKILMIGMVWLLVILSISLANLEMNANYYKLNSSNLFFEEFSENPPINEMRNKTDTANLSSIKVAIVYESVIDQMRDIKDVSNILSEAYTGYIHRGFFRWRGFAWLERKYDVYGILKENIARIKERNPYIIFGGAIAAQEINRTEYDPLTGEILDENKTWEMALDPQKYGFNMSKEELHELYWNQTGNEMYIFPDIINPDFQKLFLDHVKIQIDSGVDAIWIDGLFSQAGIFARLANSTSHPSIEIVFDAIRNTVDEIHNYGKSKGKYVYVGSWAQTAYPYPPPDLDFVTSSPSAEEVMNKTLNEEKWEEKIEKVRETHGNIPIVAFIDWAFTTDTPLGVFSQTLSKEEAEEALWNFDRFFRENNVTFAYPVHGGFMGRDATKLAFGKYYKYDSLAPEFETYDMIRKLAESKSKGIPMVRIAKPRNHLYIFDREVFSLRSPIIIGKIAVEVDAYSGDGVDRVEFYIDNGLKVMDDSLPYEWLWNERVFGKHVIKVIAYDRQGNKSEDEIDVIIFNLGGGK